MSIFCVGNSEKSQQIVGDDVEDWVGPAAGLLIEALKHSRNELTLQSVIEAIREEKYQLWLMFEDYEVKTVLVTSLLVYPSGKKVCCVVALAGKFKIFPDIFEVVKNWAVVNQAVEIEAYCRPAVTRLARRYGFSKDTDRVSLDLRRCLQ